MNTYSKVQALMEAWRGEGLSKVELAVRIAEACMGWPYIWGAYGQQCTVSTRKAYSGRGSCPSAEAEEILRRCPVCSGKQADCNGCRWHPGGVTLAFDCRGFTRWVLARIGISLNGAGATSQWNTAANWSAKGTISDGIPEAVCCVFMQNGKTMTHTGLYVGGGRVIHCSGDVKEGRITDRGWTHWAVPVGIEGDVPVPVVTKPTIRKGASGAYVVELQEDLIRLGYDVGRTGADGKAGTNTMAAVKRFQQDHPPLVADGICGSLTWAAIDEALKGGGTVLYTVVIPHLAKHHAEALVGNYTGATMTEEGGSD
jgi:cell wall-associated NlpC family hydrolase